MPDCKQNQKYWSVTQYQWTVAPARGGKGAVAPPMLKKMALVNFGDRNVIVLSPVGSHFLIVVP